MQTTVDLGLAVSLSEEHYVECRSCSLRQDTIACIDLWFEDLSVLRSKTEDSCSKQAHGASSAEESFVSLPIIEACS